MADSPLKTCCFKFNNYAVSIQKIYFAVVWLQMEMLNQTLCKM